MAVLDNLNSPKADPKSEHISEADLKSDNYLSDKADPMSGNIIITWLA